MAYLHDRGIVHRDLKPGNIFCDEGMVKVGDYGLSKFISCSRRSGHTESIGTVHYMAPEVANGRYGKEIDVYALGVILYEMLTGRVPFEGESVGEVLMKHLTAKPDVSMLAEPYRGVVGQGVGEGPGTALPLGGRNAGRVAALPHGHRARSLAIQEFFGASGDRAESSVNGHADDNAIESHLRKVGLHLNKVGTRLNKAVSRVPNAPAAGTYAWPPLSTLLEGIALLSIFIFQFFLLEEFMSGMRLLVLTPLLFLLFYFASKRILWGKPTKNPPKIGRPTLPWQ